MAIFLIAVFLLLMGFGMSALLTFLISLTGLIAFSWLNVFVVWGILILLRISFGG